MSGSDSAGKSEDGVREGAFWPAAKQSFGDMRPPSGAWDRGLEQIMWVAGSGGFADGPGGG